MTLGSVDSETLSTVAVFTLAVALVACLTQPVAATTAQSASESRLSTTAPQGVSFQQTANATNGSAAAPNGTDAGTEGGGGVVATVFGAVGGVFGAIVSFFADNIIGQAVVGLTLGVYIGLKGLAIYIERYE
jgi:hypothetical protein